MRTGNPDLQILKPLIGYYKKNEETLIYHLYDQGYSYEKIADILGVTRQAIAQKYPKK